MKILVTGGAGFIGSNFVLDWLGKGSGTVVNIDKLTYAGNLNNLVSIRNHPDHLFVQGDVGNRELVRNLLRKHHPLGIINFAAESHVDRSIHNPSEFIQTNIVGLFNLLEESLAYWKCLNKKDQTTFRFHHISTDEIYGSLDPGDPPFTEDSPCRPNSPYAASKASADHLVRSFHHTYRLPTITTNCSNNYGPYQHPEKLIPLMMINALQDKPLPVYGDGKNIRDWLYVMDHCDALRRVLAKGKAGETYNIGGWNEKTNLEVVQVLCRRLDQIRPRKKGSYRDLIQHVADRPGHDRRYAIDSRKIERDLGWKPAESFETGIEKTIHWILENQPWMTDILKGNYKDWIETNYATRK